MAQEKDQVYYWKGWKGCSYVPLHKVPFGGWPIPARIDELD
jgi:hypothetical protein